MKKLLLFVFLSSGASAAIIDNPVCVGRQLSDDATQWISIKCHIATDDAGQFEVIVSSADALIRANGDGSIRSADLSGVTSAIQAEYRDVVAGFRTRTADRLALESKRRTSAITLTPAQVE